MADGEVRAQELAQETASTLSGNEQFVMFDSTAGKRADIDDVATYVAGDKTTLKTTNKTSPVAAINENFDAIADVKEDLNDLSEQHDFSRPNTGTRTLAHSVNVGDVIKVVNDTASVLEVRIRATESGENLQVDSVPANSTYYVIASVSGSYVVLYFNAAGDATLDFGRVPTAEKTLINDSVIVDELSEQYTVSRPNSGGLIIAHTINVGDVFKVTNNTSLPMVARIRATESGENLQINYIPANSSGYVVSKVSGSYIQIYFNAAGSGVVDFGRVPTVEEIANRAYNESVFDLLVLEQGGITSSGAYADTATRLRTKNYLVGSFTVGVPDGYMIYYAVFYDKLGYFKSYSNLSKQVASITVPTNQYCKLTICKTDTSASLTVDDVKVSLIMENLDKRIETLEKPPMVQFVIDHDIDANIATIVTDKQYASGSTAMTQIYSFFDDLIDNDYVTKVDLATEMGISYPAYASGYNTYMYKFICSNANVNSGQPKKKVVMLGAVHGDEQAAPFNLYLFAQKLCNDYLTDENVFKLRSAFDFYIVPCLNGYGMIHETRWNANGININRNFPIEKWTKTGSIGGENYSGETAGSEFETQLVMALVNDVKPDMFIDHHNYAYNLDTQFYTDVWDEKQLKLVYQALVDVSYVCKKEFSQYFGTDFDFVKHNGGCPSEIGETYGYAARWAFEQFVPFAATIEISNCINYWDGELAGERKDYFGSDTFTVGEYTLRNQMLHYGQWVLDNN